MKCVNFTNTICYVSSAIKLTSKAPYNNKLETLNMHNVMVEQNDNVRYVNA